MSNIDARHMTKKTTKAFTSTEIKKCLSSWTKGYSLYRIDNECRKMCMTQYFFCRREDCQQKIATIQECREESFGAVAAVGCWVGFNFIWYVVYALYRLMIEPKMYGSPSIEAPDRPGSRLPLVETSCSSPTYSKVSEIRSAVRDANERLETLV